MIRLAVQFPEMLWKLPDNDYNGVRQEFIRQAKPVLYLPNLKWRITRGIGMRKLLRQSPLINPDEHEFAFSVGELNRKADVLVHLGQCPPLNFETLSPPRGFRGLKVWHVFEYVFDATRFNRMLEAGGVDYVLGYADHGRHCAFFQHTYPRFTERVIQFPFGAGKRFFVDAPWAERRRKVIAVGSVNLIDEPNVPGSLADYVKFHEGRQFTHEWRRMLAENETALGEVMDSQLPHFPATKNPNYDAVKVLTSYALFTNDEGLMGFPPARTYEGPAAGATMICSDHPVYGDLGFRDGINCVMHHKHDLADFMRQAEHYLKRPDELCRIATAGQKFVRTHYSHEAVARRLARQLDELYSTGRKPDTRLQEAPT